ncbi:flavin-containing monooxygenase [Rhodococcus maanshanensis]|uniref:Predicted flavoprotein CzcO associated with the cation diffusion facilitator CzcD n=1 Tax=Rhodococcus maanshanensis TaxID=183556 RepID=A0A1H7IZW2_9NOCA|nr:NAD(P)/FAD-dependent oxidoreductase [Rhodococcus maanshanensis]SEK68043.1 Predicted flavoprotein CzcO associated with the cation diffusion facilitator CzcD [Rhodococcus maanshanensis]
MASQTADTRGGAARTPHRSRVLIIGAGFSGMGMAIQLLKAGRSDFVILEKADEVGGTWRENTYPGCACDVPSHMYSFSFEPNPGWSELWSGQEEIFAYLRGLADKYGLRAKTHFGRTVDGGYWDETENRWHVRTEEGDDYVAQYLVAGVGALHVPNVPDLPGMADFGGVAFHSARWDHGYDLAGKRVAVIGTGASAVQFVPEIVDAVADLQLYQRTPAWVVPRKNLTIGTRMRRVFGLVPPVRRAFRDGIYWVSEALAIGLNGHSNLMRPLERIAKKNIARSIADPALQRKLTPDYRIGCKRILGSSDYYPALAKPNVEIISEGIERVTGSGIVAGDGRVREADAIIFATGFHVTDGFDSVNLAGVGGRELVPHWNEHGIQTHLGITVAGYPNAFFLLGPNTALGHNSVVFMIEQQIRYVLAAMALVDRSGAEAIAVRPEVQDRFNEDIQAKLSKGVWTNGGCVSWYLDAKGVNRTIWPGFTWQYWLRTRRLDPSDFELVGTVAETAAAVVETTG